MKCSSCVARSSVATLAERSVRLPLKACKVFKAFSADAMCFCSMATVALDVSIKKSSFPVANQTNLRPSFAFSLSRDSLCSSSQLGL